MKAPLLLLLSLCLLAFSGRLSGAAATTSGGKNKLRPLIRPPSANLSFGFNFDDSHGFGGKDLDLALSQAEALQKALKTDPDNAQLHFQLGGTFSDLGDTNRALQEFKKTVEFMRPKAEASPDDGALQAAFAEALSQAERYDEAERVARAAVERLPKEWHCWKELGTLIRNKASQATGRVITGKGSPDRVPELLTEAGKCFDHAIELAPDQADPYLSRIVFRMMKFLLQRSMSAGVGTSNLPDSHVSDMYPRSSIDDLWQFARLQPTNALALGTAAFCELTLAMDESGLMQNNESKESPLPLIAEFSRKRILEALTRLETLGQNSDPRSAAVAWESLGLLEVFVKKPVDALTSVRRAVSLDPSRSQAWDAMTSLLFAEDKLDDLVAACAKRVSVHDNARNRLLYARALLHAGKQEEALAQAEQSVKLAPEDLTAKLTVMALHLRLAQGEAQLDAVNREMSPLNELVVKRSWEGDDLALHECFEMNYSLFLILSGHPDLARTRLDDWIAKVPQSDWAKEILAALEP
ncbi:MAG TPA: tetratricopeptide repeat protein [Candidatus Limnocylindria bacterium]|nr:tetratricopeptide repeat protein [Candidatus Limnocylindria bacterium]